MLLMNALVTVGTKLKKEIGFILLSAVLLALVSTVSETYFVGAATAVLAAKIYLDMGKAIMCEAVQRSA